MGLFSKIKEGLKKTRDSVVGQIDSMLKSFTKIDDDLFEELEELRRLCPERQWNFVSPYIFTAWITKLMVRR